MQSLCRLSPLVRKRYLRFQDLFCEEMIEVLCIYLPPGKFSLTGCMRFLILTGR